MIFWRKPFYDGFRPLPLFKNDKALTFRRLSLDYFKSEERCVASPLAKRGFEFAEGL